MSDLSGKLRSFGMSTYLITDELSLLQKKFGVDLGHIGDDQSNTDRYYPQFDQGIRRQASEMANHYELFYCLEQTIRELISTTLFESFGPDWWSDEVIPEQIVRDVNGRMQREIDSGFSLRSDKHIDFTNFGELSIIINANWDLFGAIFSSRRAVERIMSSLNLLRGPIAHCSPLAADEVDRLHLTVKDWFRSMS
jgi:hypothetical protein